MKTVKKALSIILAVALILGTVIVAVSAANDGTEMAYWTLKAQVTDATGAQEAQDKNIEFNPPSAPYTVTKQQADKRAFATNKDNIPVQTGTDTIYVKPGQVVWVTTHIRTTDNLYPGEFQAQFTYNADVFVSSTGTYAQVAVWNDGVFSQYANGNNGGTWARMTAANRIKYSPSTLTSDEIQNKWHSYNWIVSTSMDLAPEGVYYPLNEDLVSVPLYVRPDAVEGTTGKIYMTNVGTKYLIIGNAVDGIPDVSYSATRLSASQHDVTNAVLNFKVGDPPSALDTTELETQISAYEALTSTAYTDASWLNATTAYNAAKAARSATTQDDIDAAAAALATAITNLVPKTVLNFDRLNAAIASVPSDLTPYTAPTAAAVTTTLADAQAALNATTQSAIDNAAIALENAVAALKLKANVANLQAAVNEANSLTASNYTEASWSNLAQAVSAGQAILDNAAAISDQTAVDNATDAINTAIDNLVPLGANFTELDAELAYYATLTSTNYTESTWSAYATAIAAGQAIANNKSQYSVSDQSVIDAAVETIVIARGNLVLKAADLTALNAAIAEFGTLTASHYTAASWAPYAAAVAEAQSWLNQMAHNGLTILQQPQVDECTLAITTAKGNLVEADADYTAVDAALADVPADLTKYTDASVATLNAAVNAVVRGLKAKDQARVDGFATAINTAIRGLALKDVDLTALNAVITEAQELNYSLYTAASYEALMNVLESAILVQSSAVSIEDQPAVDQATQDVRNAINNLEYVGANFSALDAALDAAGQKVEAHYTATSWSALATAVAVGQAIADNKTNYDVNDQPEIDAAAAAINTAINGLVEADADYTAVNAAKQAAQALYSGDYTPASWAALQEAISAVVTGLKAKDQATVDGFATAINTAIGNLVWAECDYTQINNILTAVEGLTKTNYTPASWAALQIAIDNIVTGLTYEHYEQFLAMESALITAYTGLARAGLADYSAVEAQIDRFAAIDTTNCTAASVAAVNAAIDAVVYKLNENFQSQVDGYAAAIKDAIDNLVYNGDYSAVQAQMDRLTALNQDLYTDESVAAVISVINSINWNLTANEQATIDGYAAALKTAIDNLQLKPVAGDYTAVNAQISRFEALNEGDYTHESWAAVIAEIETVNWNLTNDQQATIDGYAAAIKNAIDALELAPSEGKVTGATYTPSAYRQNDYVFTVSSRAVKIRLVNKADNSTITIDRNAANVSIVSYNAAGAQVSSLSRDLAYEVWTVNMSLNPGSYAVISRDNTTWESVDLAKTLVVTLSTADKGVASITAPETVTAGENFNVTVVTGADVLKVQILVDDQTAGVKTFDVQTYGALADGSCTYNVFAKVFGEGTHTLKVRVRTADGWEVVDGVTATVTV